MVFKYSIVCLSIATPHIKIFGQRRSQFVLKKTHFENAFCSLRVLSKVLSKGHFYPSVLSKFSPKCSFFIRFFFDSNYDSIFQKRCKKLNKALCFLLISKVQYGLFFCTQSRKSPYFSRDFTLEQLIFLRLFSPNSVSIRLSKTPSKKHS